MPIFNFYAVYVDWPFYDCFMTNEMYILYIFVVEWTFGVNRSVANFDLENCYFQMKDYYYLYYDCIVFADVK